VYPKTVKTSTPTGKCLCKTTRLWQNPTWLFEYDIFVLWWRGFSLSGKHLGPNYDITENLKGVSPRIENIKFQTPDHDSLWVHAHQHYPDIVLCLPTRTLVYLSSASVLFFTSHKCLESWLSNLCTISLRTDILWNRITTWFTVWALLILRNFCNDAMVEGMIPKAVL
jgi:hypothetical protein